MANVDIRQGYKNAAWFTSNATRVLKEGQVVHLEQTGTYKVGDGTTQLSALAFLGGSGGGGQVDTVQGTTNRISVDATDPANPIVNISSAYDTAITNEIAAAVANVGRPALYKDAGLFTHTGTTSETKIYSHLITEGTIQASDLITFIIRAFPNGGGGSKTIRIKANTIDSLVGATTLVTYTFTISALTLRRHMFMQGGLSSQMIMLPTTSDGDDGDTAYNASNASSSLLTVNFGVNQYIMVSAQLATSGEQILFYHSIATLDR